MNSVIVSQIMSYNIGFSVVIFTFCNIDGGWSKIVIMTTFFVVSSHSGEANYFVV